MSETVQVKVCRLEHGRSLDLPAYQSAQAAGMDLYAAIDVGRPMIIAPGGRAIVPTGIAIELAAGYEAQVRPRSGLAAKHGVTVLNAPGTIDADYRGEIKVILINLGDQPFAIARGDRIAQLVVQPVSRVSWDERNGLAASTRGEGGFGSSGRK